MSVSKNHHYVPKWHQKQIIDLDKPAIYLNLRTNKRSEVETKRHIEDKITAAFVKRNMNNIFTLTKPMDMSTIDNAACYNIDDSIETNGFPSYDNLVSKKSKTIKSLLYNGNIREIHIDDLIHVGLHLYIMGKHIFDNVGVLIKSSNFVPIYKMFMFEGGKLYGEHNYKNMIRMLTIKDLLYSIGNFSHARIIECVDFITFVGDRTCVDFVTLYDNNKCIMYPITSKHFVICSENPFTLTDEYCYGNLFKFYIDRQEIIFGNDLSNWEDLYKIGK